MSSTKLFILTNTIKNKTNMFDMSDDDNADCVESNSEELRDLARLAGKEAEE